MPPSPSSEAVRALDLARAAFRLSAAALALSGTLAGICLFVR